MNKILIGFVMTLVGVVVALVGGFLAWPLFFGVVLGGVSVGQGLLALGAIVFGLTVAFAGQVMIGNFGPGRR